MWEATQLCLTDPSLNDYRLNILYCPSNSARFVHCVACIFNVAGKAFILWLPLVFKAVCLEGIVDIYPSIARSDPFFQQANHIICISPWQKGAAGSFLGPIRYLGIRRIIHNWYFFRQVLSFWKKIVCLDSSNMFFNYNYCLKWQLHDYLQK